ncbi:dihydropteroate synthase [Methanoplanus endosymbiosus]|uniref:dihydropteroate synthase n=1 Tax=Methanoplanus endosymbiosus TaxID=33865 RepID=A0A9E7TJC1_9EURY|nr:dihydropteroate synthase [Methanoplanus endosymbiosus]UUX93478.1 dihydropteroate synthase [Methanoplanus endosymbiosus]
MKDFKIGSLTIKENGPVKLIGIVNCSPESFFSESYTRSQDVFSKASELADMGADIIDIGARSTALNAEPISVSEEIFRVKTALKDFSGSGIPVSLDTMHPEVLTAALRYDIDCINDISGLCNPDYAEIAGDSGLPAILMAAKEKPGDSLGIKETTEYLRIVMQRAENSGIENVILDPGIGRWTDEKTPESDWEVCRQFSDLKVFDRPLLAAVSRKSFIGDLLKKPAEERLSGTLAVTMHLLHSGAGFVRAHDTEETRDIIDVYEKLNLIYR